MASDDLADVIDLLITDHARIAELIEAGDLWAVVRELSKHLVGEDQVLYPELRRVADADDLVDAWLDSDRLLEEALRVGGHRTKKATVTEALEEYIRRRKQARVLKLFGKVEFDPTYDYKKQRRRG